MNVSLEKKVASRLMSIVLLFSKVYCIFLRRIEALLKGIEFFRYNQNNPQRRLSVAEDFSGETLFLKNVTSDLCEVCFYALGIFFINDVKQFFHLFADVFYLIMGIRVEEYFLQQIVIF